jgi:phosphatidate cytidylyltransferase
MSLSGDSFSDLAARLASGAVIAAIGLSAMWAGGLWFLALIAVLTGGMVWELVRMLNPGAAHRRAVIFALVAGGAVFAARLVPEGFGLPLLFAPALAGLSMLTQNRTLFLVFTVLILIAGFGVHIQRDEFGFIWMAWLAAVVIATDMLGYFAGRLIGGPKFWPAVSPKKTWSGTATGWVAAALVGAGFMGWTGAGAEILGISVAFAMASQAGDIAESAVKRRMGVKDASNLIPGHGGLLDRFDGMLGASVFLLLVEALVDFPPPPLTP